MSPQTVGIIMLLIACAIILFGIPAKQRLTAIAAIAAANVGVLLVTPHHYEAPAEPETCIAQPELIHPASPAAGD